MLRLVQYLRRMDQIKRTKPGVYYVNNKCLTIDISLVNFLIDECRKSDINSARICLHESHQSDLMVMLVVVVNGYVYPTHKHEWKDESYTIIRGSARFQSLNGQGVVQTSIELEEGQTILNNMREYHRIEPKAEILAFIETTTGPFDDRPLQFLEK